MHQTRSFREERPILMTGARVRQVLARNNSQTRRLIKLQPDSVHDGEPYWNIGGYRAWQFRRITDVLRMGTHNPLTCPYGKVGDNLWVRETWAPLGGHAVLHRATNIGYPVQRWHSPTHMPQWASRIMLEITDIRVQRLQDITEEDAKAEGVEPWSFSHQQTMTTGELGIEQPFRGGFAVLWDEMNDRRAPWLSNPWVWAISFVRATKCN